MSDRQMWASDTTKIKHLNHDAAVVCAVQFIKHRIANSKIYNWFNSDLKIFRGYRKLKIGQIKRKINFMT